jgi:adenosylcobyric acid synthase
VFEEEKVTTRVKAVNKENKVNVYGYEIHMGICNYGEGTKELFIIEDKNNEKVNYKDGAINEKGNVMGSYIHGLFDGVEFREYILNVIRVKKGMEKLKSKEYENIREIELDKLADIVRDSLDIKAIYEIMGIKAPCK